MRRLPLVVAALLLSATEPALAAPGLVPEGWHEIPPSASEGSARVFISQDGEVRLVLGHLLAQPGDRDRLRFRDGETVTYERQVDRGWLCLAIARVTFSTAKATWLAEELAGISSNSCIRVKQRTA